MAQSKIYISKEGYWFLLFWVFLIFIAINTSAGWIFILFSLLTGAILINLVFILTFKLQLKYKRVFTQCLFVGHKGRMKLIFYNNSKRTLVAGIKEELPWTEEKEFNLFLYLKKGEEKELHYKFTPKRRGVFTIASPSVIAGLPVGLICRKISFSPLSFNITVYPKVYELPLTFSSLFTKEERGKSSITAQTGGYTTDFYKVREYTPGDSLKLIHWRSSAKTGKLIVKEFTAFRESQEFLIGIDNRGNKAEVDEVEENIILVASLVNYLSKINYPFSLFSLKSSLYQPSLNQALNWLAELKIFKNYPDDLFLLDFSTHFPRSIFFTYYPSPFSYNTTALNNLPNLLIVVTTSLPPKDLPSFDFPGELLFYHKNTISPKSFLTELIQCLKE